MGSGSSRQDIPFFSFPCHQVTFTQERERERSEEEEVKLSPATSVHCLGSCAGEKFMKLDPNFLFWGKRKKVDSTLQNEVDLYWRGTGFQVLTFKDGEVMSFRS